MGALGLGVPLVSTILAACSAPTAVAPTSPPTTGAAPTIAATTAPAAANPTAAPTSAPAATTAPAAAATPPQTSASKSKAIISITQEPTSLDPTADATASIGATLRDNLYEGLVRLDGSGKIVGSLARSWDISPD